LIGQTGSVFLWKTLSGDVSSVTAAGALTLQSVNGIPFSSSYSANGVLIGEGTNAFHSVATLNVGQCLLSQGASDPIWSSCAAGFGSAGGSNSQVQFNNATSLGGSPNFTWVSPTLTLGLAGSVTGQLALAPSGSGSGTVTLQNPSTTFAYNFNLPTTAGSSGQPLLSGGGGSTAMSFGTLGIGGGGTNCTTASGTCLDNIAGFSSTGFVQRTGSGSYTFSLVVPVSGGGTGLANGTSGGILGFTGSSTIASSGLLTLNGVVIGGGSGATPASTAAGTNGQLFVGTTSAAPAFVTASGDISAITAAGAFTIANSAVTVAKQANAAAWTLEGNFTSGSTAPQFSTIGALTNKASPASSDLILIQDQAASGALKYATVSSIAAAGSVGSLNSLTGALSIAGGTGTSVTSSGSTITVANTKAQQATRITTTGNFTTPSTVTTSTVFKITLVGGGNSGASSGTSTVGGGGGAGGAVSFWVSGLSPSTSYAVTIGAAGGGTTSLVVGATTYSCTGGTAGGAASTTNTTNTQGSCSASILSLPFVFYYQTYGTGQFIASGSSYFGVQGGGTPFGTGGYGGVTNAGPGVNGIGFGAGGGGGVGSGGGGGGMP